MFQSLRGKQYPGRPSLLHSYPSISPSLPHLWTLVPQQQVQKNLRILHLLVHKGPHWVALSHGPYEHGRATSGDCQSARLSSSLSHRVFKDHVLLKYLHLIRKKSEGRSSNCHSEKKILLNEHLGLWVHIGRKAGMSAMAVQNCNPSP